MTDVTIRRALLSVSDKSGLADLGSQAGQGGSRAGLDRRHRQGAARGGPRRARRLRPDRLSRNDGRPGQDAAPDGPRRPAGGARQSRTCRGDGSARHRRDRPGGGQPLPVRGDRGARRRPRRRSSRTSTSAGRSWSARRPRTTRYVTIVTDPADYDALFDELAANDGATTLDFRKAMAAKAFAATAAYDAMISQWFAFADQRQTFPDMIAVNGRKLAELRYGENPHQQAALYAPVGPHIARPAAGRAGAGQGAELQQLQRCRRRARTVRRVRGPATRRW